MLSNQYNLVDPLLVDSAYLVNYDLMISIIKFEINIIALHYYIV